MLGIECIGGGRKRRRRKKEIIIVSKCFDMRHNEFNNFVCFSQRASQHTRKWDDDNMEKIIISVSFDHDDVISSSR